MIEEEMKKKKMLLANLAWAKLSDPSLKTPVKEGIDRQIEKFKLGPMIPEKTKTVDAEPDSENVKDLLIKVQSPEYDVKNEKLEKDLDDLSMTQKFEGSDLTKEEMKDKASVLPDTSEEKIFSTDFGDVDYADLFHDSATQESMKKAFAAKRMQLAVWIAAKHKSIPVTDDEPANK